MARAVNRDWPHSGDLTIEAGRNLDILFPRSLAFPEKRSGIAFQSHVGHTVPSTSAVPLRPVTSAGSGTNGAHTLAMAGRIRSQRRRIGSAGCTRKCCPLPPEQDCGASGQPPFPLTGTARSPSGLPPGMATGPGLFAYQQGQHVKLPGGQPCEILILQRVLP